LVNGRIIVRSQAEQNNLPAPSGELGGRVELIANRIDHNVGAQAGQILNCFWQINLSWIEGFI